MQVGPDIDQFFPASNFTFQFYTEAEENYNHIDHLLIQVFTTKVHETYGSIWFRDLAQTLTKTCVINEKSLLRNVMFLRRPIDQGIDWYRAADRSVVGRYVDEDALIQHWNHLLTSQKSSYTIKMGTEIDGTTECNYMDNMGTSVWRLRWPASHRTMLKIQRPLCPDLTFR